MERVECVTDQVRCSQSNGGEVKVVLLAEEAYLEGARMVIVDGGAGVDIVSCERERSTGR